MLSMLLILFVCAVNFAIGFAIAVHMGHGPVDFGLPVALRDRLPAFLRPRGDNQHAHPPAAH